jgi:ParB-like chromosome segregation protein Spo0J
VSINSVQKYLKEVEKLPIQEKIIQINELRKMIHEISPFKNEPVDCVLWIKGDDVSKNDYNPNSVAPPEMELLRTSIMNDGYTQPIVAYPENGTYTVVDGFHRNRVGKECEDVKERIMGYLPLTIIRDSQQSRENRIASTIRHNRARGKHKVESMSDIVIELKKRNWSTQRISKELGMDEDEILRLCQISGLVEVFKDEDFSKAWEVEIFKDEELKQIDESDIKSLEQDEGRILHSWDKWECYPAGFYEDNAPDGLTNEDCEVKYKELLSNIPMFEDCMEHILNEWINSCEHYLSNERMNRIAWLGQASLCYKYKIPSRFRGGYNLLSDEQKLSADKSALKYLNKWLVKYGRKELSLEEAQSKTEMDLY